VNAQFCCPVVELRQYSLHPGMRDTLIDLFDREFVEGKEATGIVSSLANCPNSTGKPQESDN
jgi:hypothetical protein